MRSRIGWRGGDEDDIERGGVSLSLCVCMCECVCVCVLREVHKFFLQNIRAALWVSSDV